MLSFKVIAIAVAAVLVMLAGGFLYLDRLDADYRAQRAADIAAQREMAAHPAKLNHPLTEVGK